MVSSASWLAVLSIVFAVKAHQYVVSKVQQPELNEAPLYGNAYMSSEKLQFKIDTAKLTVVKDTKEINYELAVNVLSDHCYKCAFYTSTTVDENKLNSTFLVDTNWPMTIVLQTKTTNCSLHYKFGERGEYILNFVLQNESCVLSSPKIITEPWNSSLPICWAFLILLGVGLIYIIGEYLYKKYLSTNTSALITNDLGDPSNEGEFSSPDTPPKVSVPKGRERIVSIDCFRGLCLVVMIFVNYGGGSYWFFNHSAWNGLTVADLVFPWFMFIMGINITMSINSLLKRSTPMKEIILKLIKRTIVLFALGLFIINHNSSWGSIRVPGVLQRFAIAYLFGFSIQLAFHKIPDSLDARYRKESGETTWGYHFRDILPYWIQWLIVFILEAIWLLITFVLPVPGCPTGYLGPGGLADGGMYANETCVGGAAGYIDRWMFGEKHMYGHPTCKSIYYPSLSNEEKVFFDPEGVLGSINGCVLVFLGSQVGKIFIYYNTVKERCVRWISWAIILGVISLILTKASSNEGFIPVNKNLWSISFITTLSAMAFLLITLFYVLVDVWKIYSGSPLDFVGMNSILLYVGHETFQSYVPFSWGLDQYSTHAEWLFMNLVGVTLWVIIAYLCYRNKFFLKI